MKKVRSKKKKEILYKGVLNEADFKKKKKPEKTKKPYIGFQVVKGLKTWPDDEICGDKIDNENIKLADVDTVLNRLHNFNSIKSSELPVRTMNLKQRIRVGRSELNNSIKLLTEVFESYYGVDLCKKEFTDYTPDGINGYIDYMCTRITKLNELCNGIRDLFLGSKNPMSLQEFQKEMTK